MVTKMLDAKTAKKIFRLQVLDWFLFLIVLICCGAKVAELWYKVPNSKIAKTMREINYELFSQFSQLA